MKATSKSRKVSCANGHYQELVTLECSTHGGVELVRINIRNTATSTRASAEVYVWRSNDRAWAYLYDEPLPDHIRTWAGSNIVHPYRKYRNRLLSAAKLILYGDHSVQQG